MSAFATLALGIAAYCGHIDTVEVTATSGAYATAAKLHGTFSEEGAAAQHAFLWLQCDAGDTPCMSQLARQIGKAGSDEPIYFGSPSALYPEGQAGAPLPLVVAHLDTQPANVALCLAALAPQVVSDAGASDAYDPNNPQGVPDNSACAVGLGRRGAPAAWLAGALLLLALLRRPGAGVSRRRGRRRAGGRAP